MMESVSGQVLLGVYLGVLTGIIPALVAWLLGFTFKYFTGFTVPGLGVVVLAAALAGVSGGLMGLIDPAISSTYVGVTALLVVLMMSLWAHGNGDQMGDTFPKRITLKSIRERTLEADVVERMGSFGQVKIHPSGTIGHIEGYPPLPEPVAQRMAGDVWTFPSDLTIHELERKLAERLLTDYDLADVSVTIDAEGRATIAAAPAPGGLSRRIESGRRAISVETLIPSGTAVGDEVTIPRADGDVVGTVVSAKSERAAKKDATVTEPGKTATADATSGTVDGTAPAHPVAPTATGGAGRLTLSVSQRDARRLLETDAVDRVLINARGKRREFELVSLLKKAGNRFRKFRVTADSPLVDHTLAESHVRESYGVAVLAIRRPAERIVAPGGAATIAAGDALYVVGSPEAMTAFGEVV